MELEKKGSVLGGTLLIAGTAIGGGMLALPVLTALGGFIPAVVIYFLCWIFMACTGLLLVEVFLWSQKEVNLVSMAKMTLGLPGKVIAWCLYIFLFYSLTIAYIAGGGHLVGDFFTDILHLNIPSWLGSILFVLIFAPFVVISAYAVDRINRILMVGLIVSFLVFIVIGFSHVDATQLTHHSWPLALLATPVVFTSFGFQGTVPTLTNYMGRDPFRTRLVICFGSAIPFLAYVIWEWLILGIIPLEGLEDALMQGQSAVYPLKNVLHISWLYGVGQFFAFFAIVTSFLGVTIGLLDFLADGFKVKKTVSGRWLLGALIFLPPLAFAATKPEAFLFGLHYAGGFGCALLLGLLPILMVWRGRYRLKYEGVKLIPGGRFVLSLLVIFIIFELIVMVLGIG